MSTFAGALGGIRFYTSAECKKCDGAGMLSTARLQPSGDGYRVSVVFCECAKMITVVAPHKETEPNE